MRFNDPLYKSSFGPSTDVQLRFFAGRVQRHERLGGFKQRQFKPQRNVRQGAGDVHKGRGRRQTTEEQLGRCSCSRGRSLRGGRREWLLVDQLARQQQLSYVP